MAKPPLNKDSEKSFEPKNNYQNPFNMISNVINSPTNENT